MYRFYLSPKARVDQGHDVRQEDVVQWLNNHKGVPVYEDLSVRDRVVPYFDFEKDFHTDEEARQAYGTLASELVNAIRTAYPTGTVLSYYAIGPKYGKRGRDDDVMYRVSIHALVRGAGYVTNVKDIVRVSMCDQRVYRSGNRNLFRVPIIAPKTLTDRRVLVPEDGRTQVALIDLAGYTDAEQVVCQPHIVHAVAVVPDDVVDMDAPPREAGTDMADTLYRFIEDLCASHISRDSEEYTTWIRMLYAFRKVFDSDQFARAARLFSESSGQYRIDEPETLRIIQSVARKSPKDIRIGIDYIRSRLRFRDPTHFLISNLGPREEARFEEGYYWNEFVTEYCSLQFPSETEVYEWVCKNAPRAVAPARGLTEWFVYEEEHGYGHITTRKTKQFAQSCCAFVTLSDRDKKGNRKVMPLMKVLERYGATAARVYSSYGYYPNIERCPDGVYNASGPTRATLLEEYARAGIDNDVCASLIDDELAAILHHIRDHICAGVQEHYEYFMSWMHTVCVERLKSNVVLFLGGVQGTGKSAIPEFVAKWVLGPNVSLVTETGKRVVGEFNHILVQRELVVINEIDLSSMTGSLESIKGLVTGETMVANRKFCDERDVPNNLNLIFTSNLENVIKMEEHQRRFVAFSVDHHPENSIEYFNKLFAKMTTNSGDRFYTYLTYVVPHFKHDLNIRPATKMMFNMQQRGLKSTKRFLQFVQYRLRKTAGSGPEFENEGWDGSRDARRSDLIDWDARRLWIDRKYFQQLYRAFCWSQELKTCGVPQMDYDFNAALKSAKRQRAYLYPGGAQVIYYDLNRLLQSTGETPEVEEYDDLNMRTIYSAYKEWRITHPESNYG